MKKELLAAILAAAVLAGCEGNPPVAPSGGHRLSVTDILDLSEQGSGPCSVTVQIQGQSAYSAAVTLPYQAAVTVTYGQSVSFCTTAGTYFKIMYGANVLEGGTGFGCAGATAP